MSSIFVKLFHGDNLDVLPMLEANSMDSIVTDPPYGLSFMGKDWDHGVPGAPFWEAALRVAKPGAHLLAFGGTRTFHRLACAIEDAGWEIRDTVMWVYGSGFPKSLDISKAIDKAAGAEREVVGNNPNVRPNMIGAVNGKYNTGRGLHSSLDPLTAPATPEAAEWDGWGTALKPAWEPVIVARKPLEGTVAANVLKWGAGGINIDGCRVGTNGECIPRITGKGILGGTTEGWDRPWKNDQGALARRQIAADAAIAKANGLGRWPANLVHDGSDEVVGCFPAHKPHKMVRNRTNGARPFNNNGADTGYETVDSIDDPGGSAARFFQACPWSDDDRRLYARCALCGLPDNARHGIMTAEDMPCSSNASSAEKTLHQETTITNSGFVVTPVQQSGQHSSEDRPEQSTRNAQSAGSCFGPSPATTGDIALTSADSKQLESLVRNVKCAGNLCDLCATAIAQSIVLMKRGQSPASLHGLASISEHKKQILTQCLVSFVALLGNTDTTPTMDNLNLFFGYVRDAIANYTPTHEKRQVETQPPTRLQYVSKASKRDRDEGLEGGVTLELEVCLCGANTERGISLEKAISAYVMGLGTHEWNTTSYGSERSVLFHRVILSTTSMETSKTTESKTWSVLTSLPTSGFIAGVIRTIQECGSSLAASADSISQLLNTMSEKAVSARGAKTVVSETPLRISASARPMANGHCTVKPTALMRYLVRLVTPPNGVVLDMFMGSGSTGKAARLEGFGFVGIELERESYDIAEARIAWADNQPVMEKLL